MSQLVATGELHEGRAQPGAWLGAPLVCANEVIGGVSVQSYAPDPPYDDELVHRWIVAAESNHCRFALIANKKDLPSFAMLKSRLAQFQALGYAVAMFFDTNPKDDKDPMATDRVPDQGFIPVAAPGQPLPPPPAPPAGAPTAAAQAPTAASPGAAKPGAAPSAARPGAAVPRPPASPRTAASAGGSNPAAPGASTPSSPAGTGAAAPAPGTTTPPPGLARTGASSTTQGLFGLGIMLLGAGVVVMTRPNRRPARTVV